MLTKPHVPLIVATAILLFMTPTWSAAQSLTKQEIPQIVDASRTNELRFNRDYKGKTFSDTLPFRVASENTFNRGVYRVAFGVGSFGSGVDCSISDPKKLNEIVDWNKGLMVSITGTVRTTVMGDVGLDDCNLVPKK